MIVFNLFHRLMTLYHKITILSIHMFVTDTLKDTFGNHPGTWQMERESRRAFHLVFLV